MGSQTALGYPYPVGTDRVMDGDDAIHSLATAVEQKAGVFAAGTVTINVTQINTVTQQAVTFPAGRFTAAPFVVISVVGNGINKFPSVVSPTAAGFTATINSIAGTGNVTMHWIAIQQGA